MEINGINECIQSQAFPHSRQYQTFNEFYSDVTNAREVIVLGIYNDRQHSYYIEDQFFKAANSLGDSLHFRHLYIDSVPNVYDFELLKNLKDYSLPHILLIRPKHLWNEYETKFVVHSFGDIMEFIKFNFYGLVGLRTEKKLDYFEFPIINIYSDINYENELKDGFIQLRNKILKFSHKHNGIKFIISDEIKFTDELIENFDFKTTEQILKSVPIVTAQDINHKKFLLEDRSFTFEKLSEFVNNLQQQKFDSSLKYEDYISTGSIIEVSAQDFQELVLNSGKESLIMFYTKDCKHCSHLEKTFEKLGKALENEPNIQLVKREYISDNFVQQLTTESFPAFYWFDKNKQMVLYYGRHEFNDFIEFIAENSSDELTDFNRLGHLKRKRIVKEEL